MKIVVAGNSKIDEIGKTYLLVEEKMPELVEELADIVKTGIEDNISDSKNFDGSRPTPLSPAYKKWKQKNLGYTDIFQGKELKLIKSIKAEKVSDLIWRIYVTPDRDDIVTYLEESGRKPFGIGAKLKTELKQRTDEWLSEVLNG